jgi:prolyl-tRNA synthetase
MAFRVSCSAASRCFATATGRVTPRSLDFSKWYLDVIAAADLVDASPVKGCAILKPGGFGIWELIREGLDSRIRARGAQNAYFPLLVPASFISREAQHVQGFAKECAVVTHSRLTTTADGDGKFKAAPDAHSELHEPLVIRPTSETLIWDAFSRWVVSHRDLPLLINQWANVVRWEMRTRPFLRTSEFLWQEGHTAHATEVEAREFAWLMALMYRDFCRDVLALPVVLGRKSTSERFAGADATFTCEAMMQNGEAIGGLHECYTPAGRLARHLLLRCRLGVAIGNISLSGADFFEGFWRHVHRRIRI